MTPNIDVEQRSPGPADATQAVAERITEIVAAADRPILGSDIGQILSREFPGIRMRVDFGGLRAFIERYCSVEVRWHQKHGLDDLYIHQAHAALPSPQPSPIQPNLWRAFSNPNSQSNVVVHTDGACTVVPRDSPIPEGGILIDGLTATDYQAMASDFLGDADPATRSLLEPTLTAAPFWPAWSTALRHAGAETMSRWSAFRHKCVMTEWTTRLKKAGLDDGGIVDWSAQMERSSRIVRTRSRGTAKGSVAKSASNLRRAVVQTIERMSDDELRRLWLPVGFVFDSMD